MKASEMTNKELATQIEAYNTVSGCSCSKCECMREAARRLWSTTVRDDNSAVIAELQRRIKVAEGALTYARNSITRDCYNECDHIRECTSAHGRCKCIVEDKIENALAEIREKGDVK